MIHFLILGEIDNLGILREIDNLGILGEIDNLSFLGEIDNWGVLEDCPLDRIWTNVVNLCGKPLQPTIRKF